MRGPIEIDVQPPRPPDGITANGRVLWLFLRWKT